MSDIDIPLVNAVKNDNCENSLVQLIKKHSNLCYSICQRYMPAMMASGVHPQDVFNDKDYIIYKSALSYNSIYKIKFSTWLGNQVRYHCLNKINKDNVYITMEDSQLNYIVEKKASETIITENADLKSFIFSILNDLRDKRIGEVFQYRYYENAPKLMTWKKIAKVMNISSQTAINIHNRGRKVIVNKTQGKHFESFL